MVDRRPEISAGSKLSAEDASITVENCESISVGRLTDHETRIFLESSPPGRLTRKKLSSFHEPTR